MGEFRKLFSNLKLEMPFFSQRKISLQIAFIYSFNKAHSFIHLTNIGCASPLWRPCLSHGIRGWRWQSVSPPPLSPSHIHTPCWDLSHSICKGRHLALAIMRLGLKWPAGRSANSNPTPACLFPTNPKGWEPQILYKLCGTTSHPTLRNTSALWAWVCWELSSWRPLVVHREWGD